MAIGTYSLAAGIASAFARAARPNFELQFQLIQNGFLANIQKKTAAIEEANTILGGETALLDIQTEKAEREKERLTGLMEKSRENRGYLDNVNFAIDDMKNAADAAAFNDARDRVLQQLGRLKAISYEEYGTLGRSEGAATLKRGFREGFSDLNGAITTGAFADLTFGSISNADLDRIKTKVKTVRDLADINSQVASKKRIDLSDTLVHLSNQVEDIKEAARNRQKTAVKNLQKEAAFTLEVLSLSFDASINRAQQLAASLNPSPRPAGGSVLNLFS